jgi:hypothetical protein
MRDVSCVVLCSSHYCILRGTAQQQGFSCAITCRAMHETSAETAQRVAKAAVACSRSNSNSRAHDKGKEMLID